MNFNIELFGTLLAGFLSLMMFSFIFKDNALFKFAEHLYVGVATGYYVNIEWFQFMKPNLIEMLYPKAGNPLPDLTYPSPHYAVIIPAMLGIFIVLRLAPKLAWLSRISFAFYIGGSSGIALPVVMSTAILPQLVTATAALVPAEGSTTMLAKSFDVFNLALLFIGTFCVLIYFFFSVEHRGLIGRLSVIGIYVLMITFGAAFGNTVMARMSLLIGRFQFMMFEWIPAFRHLNEFFVPPA